MQKRQQCLWQQRFGSFDKQYFASLSRDGMGDLPPFRERAHPATDDRGLRLTGPDRIRDGGR
jgi:hypothetical protein